MLQKLDLSNLGYLDYIFVFGLDIQNNCTLGIKMDLFSEKAKSGLNKEKGIQNPNAEIAQKNMLLSRSQKQGLTQTSDPSQFDELFLYLHSLIELNFSKL